MSNFSKTITTLALIALTGIASAAQADDNDKTQSVLTCSTDYRHVMSAFKPSAGMTDAQLQTFFASAGCVDHPVHPGVAGAFKNGGRYEPVSAMATRLMRLVDADGHVVGDAVYRYTLYPLGK